MARQVFFDPFGNYTEGFNTGAGRQIQTEGATRQARAQDFDYNNLAPFRVSAAQRQDELGAATLPYQKALAPYALDTARANRYDTLARQSGEFAKAFGIPAPYEQNAYSYFGITPSTTQVGNAPPVTQFFMQGQDGNPVAVAQQPNIGQHILDYLDWNRLIQSRQLQNQQQYQQGMLQNTADRNAAYDTTAQARLYGAMGKYYGAAGGVNGGSLFGSGMPQDLMNPEYYAQPQQNQNSIQDYNLGN